MKRAFTLTLCLLFSALFTLNAIRAQEHGRDNGHNFAARELDRFHDILHPLQHEALPNNDFRTIRARAPELYAAGRAILRLPVPRGVTDVNAFRREQRDFSRALTNYRRDARRGTNARLRVSYEAVHDTFEELARMWPRG